MGLGDIVEADGERYEVVFDGRQSLLEEPDPERPIRRGSGLSPASIALASAQRHELRRLSQHTPKSEGYVR